MSLTDLGVHEVQCGVFIIVPPTGAGEWRLRNRNIPSVQIRNELQYVQAVHLSAQTVSRRLNPANLVPGRPATGPELTREHHVIGLRFAGDHQN